MNEVIASFYARLSSQIADIPIYDQVPQSSDDDQYIQFTQSNTVTDDTDTENGFEVIIRVMAFSRYRGMKEPNVLIDRIYSALHQWSMPNTTNYSVGFLIEQSRQHNVSPDGLTRYTVQDFKMWVERI
jgi:hypothetical protein